MSASGLDDACLRLLVLSPHRDDAAFSVSLSIRQWLLAGHKVTLLSAFTRSTYAPYEALEAMSEDERLERVSELRSAEDKAFISALPGNVRSLDLKFLDAPIRLRCDSTEVYQIESGNTDTAISGIRRAMAQWIESQASDELCGLVIPLAIGGHVDHRIARDAAVPFAASLPSAFYEDLPYMMRDGAREDFASICRELGNELSENLSPVLIGMMKPGAAELKRHLASVYKSQIDLSLAEAIANYSQRYDGAEQLWVNRAWREIASADQLST